MNPVPASSDAVPHPPPPPAWAPPRLVEWKGMIPEAFARYIDRLNPFDAIRLYGVVCRFGEVREIVGIARRVHQILAGGYQTNARDRWSDKEFQDARLEIHELVRKLHRYVNAVAMKANLHTPVALNKGGTCHAEA